MARKQLKDREFFVRAGRLGGLKTARRMSKKRRREIGSIGGQATKRMWERRKASGKWGA